MIGNLQEVIMKIQLIAASAIAKMKTWPIAASAIGGIFASDIIRLSVVILKKNMEIDDMPEYIEREAAIRALLNDATEQVGYSREDAADCIRYMDTADVVPVRHGRWERTADGAALCTACKRKMDPSQYGYAFCSLCGARMDGE